jgi:WD40 repeat protein
MSQPVGGPFQFSSDGKHIVSGSTDNAIQVWDIHMGHLVADLFRGTQPQLARSDFRVYFSAFRDETIRLWDTFFSCQYFFYSSQ